MRYWWVNQNQTHRQEVGGRYLWSPKRKSNRERNPYYEFMREVAPGDLIFSFVDAWIRTFGVAFSYAYESPKPAEFGTVGTNWDKIGWKIDVDFHTMPHGFRPADWIERLRPLLPERYSPLLRNGRGSQSIYLTRLPQALALALADLLGSEVGALARSEAGGETETLIPNADLLLWEDHIRKSIEENPDIPATEREALVVARKGQGRFRMNVQAIEARCRITGVDRAEHLRASHCKPWRDSNNDERLDGDNGLLLTPSIDHVFDRGFISFHDDGRLLISPVAHEPSLARMGVAIDRTVNVGSFTERQKHFLQYHRDAVFLQARVS
jgi:putative restriction endonuclease